MAEITLTVPDAWVYADDDVLFVVAARGAGGPGYDQLAIQANRALEEQGYEERLSWSWFNRSTGIVYVDPAYLLAEQWPASVVSDTAKDGWVKLYRFDISELPKEVTR